MHIKSSTPARLTLCLAGLIAVGPFTSHLHAQTTPKKAPAAPAKPAAAPAKPAPAAPASRSTPTGGASAPGHPTGGTTTTTSGRTSSTTTTSGHTGSGVTTANPNGGSSKITTANTQGGARTTTAGTGAAGSRTGAAAKSPPTDRTPGGDGAANQARSNGHPQSPKTSFERSNGHPTLPKTSSERTAPNGAKVVTRAGGGVRDVHDEKRGMDIHHDLGGHRTISVERADHSRVFAERGGRGYVQHPYNYHGHEFGHRTYYYNGRPYDRYYGRAYYGGVYLDVYAPTYYYAPAFYGWAYNPWAAPISYSWGFAAYPWYGYYGAAYFTPYPVYPSAAFWLTDYLVSQSLAAAYQAQIDANTPPLPLQGAAPLTDDIKKMVSDEVQRQIALENLETTQNAQKAEPDTAGSSIARMLSDDPPNSFQPHVFIAGANLDLVDTAKVECAVSQGDVVEVASASDVDTTAATVNALVLTTKGGKECAKADKVTVAFTDLQEMQNHMRETVDAGLSDLQKKGGQGGLPQVPPSAQGAPVESNFAAAAPPPDANVASEINEETKEADKAEQEAGAVTPVIGNGQSIAEVTNSLGQPKTIAKPRVGVQIYVYADMKITFKNGKVSNVE